MFTIRYISYFIIIIIIIMKILIPWLISMIIVGSLKFKTVPDLKINHRIHYLLFFVISCTINYFLIRSSFQICKGGGLACHGDLTIRIWSGVLRWALILILVGILYFVISIKGEKRAN